VLLLYHRIGEAGSDPWRLCVRPRHFAEQLEVLRGSVLPLAELVAARTPGRVALSFDDGYAGTLRTALPLLERHALPATVFVTTGPAADGRPFWWDDPPADRGLRGEEIARLAAHGLFEIGAHTVSHPRLPALAPAAQRREVEESRACLETLTGRPVLGFAYPHGAHAAATRRIVREAGFGWACTTAAGLLRRRTDAFRLPRLQVPDLGGEAFARWLSSYAASAVGARSEP
jgi:peptidoglycan/xylan/chitin deacetylase (PgdA/CDA1 family)